MRIRTALTAIGVTGALSLIGIAGLPAVGGLVSASPAAPAASAQVAATITATPTTAPAPPATCDDSRWIGPNGINVNDRPDRLDPGETGGVYMWHNEDGWHIRTTDRTDTAHHYTGTIALSSGGRFTSFNTVRLENGDRVWVDGDNVLHYDFTTYNGVDGVDFTVSDCDAHGSTETLAVSMQLNGYQDDAHRIHLGDEASNPPSARFDVVRTT